MDSNIVVTQVSSAAILVWGLQLLKSAKWFPWIQNGGQVALKRTISIAAAIGSHTGISFVWAPAAAAVGAGYHTFALTIPPLAVIVVTVWHWLNQYILQELIYQITANRLQQSSLIAMGLPAPVPAAVTVPGKG